MATNAEVSKNDNESAINLIRRFSKRVQGAGVIPRVRAGRYHSRQKSKAVIRKGALKRISRRDEITELIKLGKMLEKPVRGKFRR
jgi:ribosomal protein S21